MKYRATISLHKPEKDKAHLDLFLQVSDDLSHGLWTYEIDTRSWSLLREGKTFPCYAKPLHRSAYLDYEGSIPKNRGRIRIVWRGYYENREKRVKKKKYIVR